jgi:RNA binding exosome subunit
VDEQIVDLIRDQFKAVHDKIDMTHDAVNSKIDEMKETVNSHVEEDRRYWLAIDEQKAQLGLVKWIFSGASGSAILAWVYATFGKH